MRKPLEVPYTCSTWARTWFVCRYRVEERGAGAGLRQDSPLLPDVWASTLAEDLYLQVDPAIAVTCLPVQNRRGSSQPLLGDLVCFVGFRFLVRDAECSLGLWSFLCTKEVTMERFIRGFTLLGISLEQIKSSYQSDTLRIPRPTIDKDLPGVAEFSFTGEIRLLRHCRFFIAGMSSMSCSGHNSICMGQWVRAHVGCVCLYCWLY